ncbi:thermonuclease family protein [Ancylobacter mangrovi]|uniref:thermonuclease family protein n=1 Tax=Ancylobacter mangrovi TaxID=2972472 RepID=UPI0021638B1E|nr:thermonuclease family protein [Ancylobacter mangrovi]MCS0501423.1 thermonuclease family protein [Ancylobacter mangrovi]
MLAFVALCVAASIVRAEIRVLDGDTIVVNREHIRIVGLNAPEIGHAKCKAEQMMGRLARARLVEMLAAACGPLPRADGSCLELQRVPGRDRWRRSLARVRVDGVDVAGVLIREGYAERYECPRGRCPRRAAWCER